ncbi:enteropeptidase-like [Orbicella faveolata]|uniref:enteropeptidase-like n=1 Tax=Orbicella faveolata TaxID=48498 RepID=UPI0009E1C335|nr:enteropeptidase-like [Orbicella faveolata]
MDLVKAEIWRSFAKVTFIMSSLVVITSAFSCNFDTSMCGFVQDSNDNFDWTRHQGSTTSSGTGPSADHTTGNGMDIDLS